MSKKLDRVQRAKRTVSRRQFVGSTAAALGAACARDLWAAEPSTGNRHVGKVVVGAHPWVYAATQPNYDITPELQLVLEPEVL